MVRDLYGLALLPAEKRDAQINQAIQSGLKFMLEDFDLLAADYPYIEKIHPTWSKLSFPLFYQADVPFVLRLAKELDALHYPQGTKRIENGWLASAIRMEPGAAAVLPPAHLADSGARRCGQPLDHPAGHARVGLKPRCWGE